MSSKKLCFCLGWVLWQGLFSHQDQACQAAPKTLPKASSKAASVKATPSKTPAAAKTPTAASKASPAAQKKTAPATNPALTAAYNSYINALKAKIEKTWNYPDGKNHAVLSILVAPDGTVSDLKLTSAPGSPPAEQAANDAFNQAQPLPPLPTSSPPCRLTITFDSNADPHGDTKANFYIKLDALAAKPESETVPDTSAPPDVDMTKTK